MSPELTVPSEIDASTVRAVGQNGGESTLSSASGAADTESFPDLDNLKRAQAAAQGVEGVCQIPIRLTLSADVNGLAVATWSISNLFPTFGQRNIIIVYGDFGNVEVARMDLSANSGQLSTRTPFTRGLSAGYLYKPDKTQTYVLACITPNT
jgi:hypothetical protein